MIKRALVTGATGFIGRHLVERLIDLGVQVIIAPRSGTTLPAHWRRPDIEVVDRTDAELDRVLVAKDFEVIYHLAAYGTHYLDRDPDPMFRMNVALPAKLVRVAAQRGAGMLMAGTSEEYLRPELHIPVAETQPLQTERIYGASKAAGGLMAKALAAHLRVRFRILRLFNVFGPGEAPHRLLPTLATALARGDRVPLSAGNQIRDFVYVGDVVEAFVRAEHQMASSDRPDTAIWNVCTGTGRSVRAFASTVAAEMGASADLLGFGDLPMRPEDDTWFVGDSSRLRHELGWQPSFDLAAGIRASLLQLTAPDRTKLPLVTR